MPIASPAQDKLNAMGIDTILDLIYNGKTQAEIAQSLNLSAAQLNMWIHRNPEWSTRARSSMAASAEAWIDRGLQYVLDARSDTAEIQRARVLESHCARRAAIRNPQYRDKQDVQHSGQVELRSITRRIIDTALPMVQDVTDALPAHARAVLDSAADTE